jgi:hypothetical protein
MHTWLRLSAGLAVGCLLWTGTALGQARPACDQQAKLKTPERVEGEVTKVDMAQGRVTVRQSDGTVHEFQASPETLQDLKVGGRVEAKLRAASNC